MSIHSRLNKLEQQEIARLQREYMAIYEAAEMIVRAVGLDLFNLAANANRKMITDPSYSMTQEEWAAWTRFEETELRNLCLQFESVRKSYKQLTEHYPELRR